MAVTKTFDVFWGPTGQKIATVQATTAKAAKRKAPQPYRKYLGEIYVEQVGGSSSNPNWKQRAKQVLLSGKTDSLGLSVMEAREILGERAAKKILDSVNRDLSGKKKSNPARGTSTTSYSLISSRGQHPGTHGSLAGARKKAQSIADETRLGVTVYSSKGGSWTVSPKKTNPHSIPTHLTPARIKVGRKIVTGFAKRVGGKVKVFVTRGVLEKNPGLRKRVVNPVKYEIYNSKTKDTFGRTFDTKKEADDFVRRLKHGSPGLKLWWKSRKVKP